MTKYLPKEGSYLSKKEAQEIGEELARLTQLHGGTVTPAQIVAEARRPTNYLHKYFDWDNTKAAQKWREQQARVLIHKIVEVVVSGENKMETRSFFNVKNKQGDNVYVTVKTAIGNKQYLMQIISDAQKQIQSLNTTLQLFLNEIEKQ